MIIRKSTLLSSIGNRQCRPEALAATAEGGRHDG